MSAKTTPKLPNSNRFVTIKCLPRPDLVGGMMFWCPNCNKMHYHGRGNGHRGTHCRGFKAINDEIVEGISPLDQSGYIVEMFNKTELKMIAKAIDKYLKWNEHQ